MRDIHDARALLARVPPMRRLIADKACDGIDIGAFLSA